MEIQNLRLQLLHIADGDVEKAQAMENYITGVVEAEINVSEDPAPYQSANLGEEPKAAEGRNAGEPKECGCFLCTLSVALKEQNIKF